MVSIFHHDLDGCGLVILAIAHISFAFCAPHLSSILGSALSVPEVSSTVPLSSSPTISSSGGNPTKEQRASQSASKKASTSSMKVEPKETAKSSKAQLEVRTRGITGPVI